MVEDNLLIQGVFNNSAVILVMWPILYESSAQSPPPPPTFCIGENDRKWEEKVFVNRMEMADRASRVI